MKYVLAIIVLTCPSLAWAFDATEYRQATYGTPDHYCDLTLSIAAPSGSGTLGDPWNATRCMSEPVAGDVIGVLPGASAVLVSTDGDNYPTFRPANSGTVNAPIVYVTKYAAVALSDIGTNPNRTQLRHDGTAPAANGQVETGTGSPMYGVNGQNYIIYDGFYVDVSAAWSCGDCGIIRAESATGTQFLNFVLKGATVNMVSNATMYRAHDTVDTVLRNFKAYDWINDPTGSDVPQQGYFSIQYSDRNFLIEQFEITNVERGIFPKGTSPQFTNYNYGTIRYGILSNMHQCYQLNDLHATNVTTIDHTICDVYTLRAFSLSSQTTAARNLLIHHNTVARGDGSDANHSGPITSAAEGIGSNVVIRDNIFDQTSGSYGALIHLNDVSTLPTTLDYNGYQRYGGTARWMFNGATYTSIGTWRTATSLEANSTVVTDPFVNRATGDLHVSVGHAAKTASSTGGELGAYEGGHVIGVDVASSVSTAISGGVSFIGGVRIQ